MGKKIKPSNNKILEISMRFDKGDIIKHANFQNNRSISQDFSKSLGSLSTSNYL